MRLKWDFFSYTYVRYTHTHTLCTYRNATTCTETKRNAPLLQHTLFSFLKLLFVLFSRDVSFSGPITCRHDFHPNHLFLDWDPWRMLPQKLNWTTWKLYLVLWLLFFVLQFRKYIYSIRTGRSYRVESAVYDFINAEIVRQSEHGSYR